MRACKSLALLACLALLGAGAAAAACSAEESCVASNCGSSYEHPADHLPYSVAYTTTGDSLTTSFIFKVCSTSCQASDPLCKPLKAFRLRLADEVLAKPADFIKMALPDGTIEDSCAAAGPGWFVSDAELLSLNTHNPAEGEVCEMLSVSVYNPTGSSSPLTLSDICQQDVKIVQEDGTVVFNQADSGASCLFTLELTDGTSGVGALEQLGPQPSPTPSPAPAPAPPTPGPYYGAFGGSGRRLQQAPMFLRSLSYYGGSGSGRRLSQYYGGSGRRLSSASEESMDVPLAFATRRLMEATAVPLPMRLASAHVNMVGLDSASRARHLTYYGQRRSMLSVGDGMFGAATGRQLSYYGQRRSMLSFDEPKTVGTTGRQLSYYGQRRSMLSFDEPKTVGTTGRQLSYYGQRRSMLSVDEPNTIGTTGRQLSYYGQRRSMLSFDEHTVGATAGRQLTYYGQRRSMLSFDEHTVGATAGRQLTYYGQRRSMLSADEGALGSSGRQLSYYGQRRSMLSAGFGQQSIGRQLSYYGSK